MKINIADKYVSNKHLLKKELPSPEADRDWHRRTPPITFLPT